MVYYGRRYYSPSQGRFLGRDPKGELGGTNLYGFTANNPVNRWDYLGMSSPRVMDPFVVNGGNREYRRVIDTYDGCEYEEIWQDFADNPGYDAEDMRLVGRTQISGPLWPIGDGGDEEFAPNRTAVPNANDTLLGRASLFIAQVGGQTADNALNTATVAAIGAQEGLAKHVSISGEAGLNVMPIIPRSRQYGPHPFAGGVGVGGEVNFRDGPGGSVNGQLSAGKFGGYGELGITFTIPLSGGNTVGNLGVGGGAGPGGKIQVEFDRNGTPTALKVTIGAGFGFEVGGNLGFPNQPPPKK